MSNVPKLRFKEFSNEFENDVLDELLKITSKKYDPSIELDIKRCIELEHLSQETGNLLGYTTSNEQASIKNYFKKGQVLFGKLRPYLKKFWLADFDGVCSSEIWVLDGKKLTNNYLFHLVQTTKFNQIANISSGSKMPRSDWQYMSQVPFNFPSKPEQEKIASFLSPVDKKIEHLTNKEGLLHQYKKGVMQKIFSGAIRFKADDGSEYAPWEEKKLGEVFDRITTKNKENNLNVLTISAQQGLINQEKYFNKSVSAKDITGYYLLHRDDFAYNKSYSNGYPLGAIKRLSKYDKGVVSTLYICFRAKHDNVSFLEQLFENGVLNREIHKIAQEGARNHGLLNISVVEFFKDIHINIPSLEEQTKIANFLSSIDTKIVQIKKQLNLNKSFKKALLQQMFV